MPKLISVSTGLSCRLQCKPAIIGGIHTLRYGHGLLGFLDALPDGVELALDQALGHVELVSVGELVEKLALDHRARDLRVVLADTLGDRLAHGVEVLEVVLLGELIVGRLVDDVRAERGQIGPARVAGAAAPPLVALGDP